MSKEAMKLALDALEEINKLSIGENAICLPAEIDGAMDALREALTSVPDWASEVIEQPAQQCWKCGDMDAAFQAKCNVPACGMKEQP